MFLQFLKRLLYRLLSKSGILYHFLPFLNTLRMETFYPLNKRINHWIEDDSGNLIGVTKVNGRLYPAFGEERLLTVKNIRVKDDDVFLCGYPKSGTHWTFEILHMLTTKNPILSSGGKGCSMIEMIPDLFLDSLPSPRVMNSHLSFEELPTEMKVKENKIILTMRSPKDTVVSFYNHHTTLVNLYDYKGSFDNFFKLFMKGSLEYGSYFEFYRKWAKVLKTQTKTQILLLRFEELKNDPISAIKKMATFLDITVTDKFVENVAIASGFRALKQKRPNDPIFRKGIVGDWTNWLSQEQSDQIDRVWNEHFPDYDDDNFDIEFMK